MSRTVLVVAAHPDDEVLGVGGTVAAHSAAGDDVHVLILAEGETSRTDDRSTATPALEALRQSAENAARILGAHPPRFAALPDNRMDKMALLDVVKTIEAVVAETRPSVVYTHHGGDLNVDHRISHLATLTACRPLPESPVRDILCFETVSSTEWESPAQGTVFTPTVWIDIAAALPAKIEALRAYEREMRPFPHARSMETVDALARLRGSQAGLHAAEAFALVRSVRGGA